MAAHQAPLSLGFSRQEYWSGLPFSSPMHGSEKWKWSRSVVSTLSWSRSVVFPASGFFPISQFFASDSQSIGASASESVLPMNIQGLFPLGMTGFISVQSKGLSRVFFSTIQRNQFFDGQHSLWSLTSIFGEGNGNPLQSSCLENPRDRGAWWAAVYGVAQSRTRLKRVSSSTSICMISMANGLSFYFFRDSS